MMSAANLVDGETTSRRYGMMANVVAALALSIPIAGLFLIVGFYAYQLGRTFAFTKRLYITLPAVFLAGVFHFFAPIWIMRQSGVTEGVFWIGSAASFAIYFFNVWMCGKAASI